MALQEKYKSVIDSINAAGGRDVQITEDGGVLKVAATVPYPKDKNAVWNKIKKSVEIILQTSALISKWIMQMILRLHRQE
ncbi:MAG: hypothetical protein IPI04_05905 [Ignavibacteria bacterium]|nr:hypothetical protein [Ignavibacteria bacterium]